jgi:carboxyl-terminal processing protease
VILRRLAPLLVAVAWLAGCAPNLPFAVDGVVPPPVVVADGSPERRALNARVYDAAVGYVAEHYYDRDLRGVDWAGEAAARREAAIAEPTEQGFYARMHPLFDLLDDRHTSVTSPSRRAELHASRLGQSGAGLGLSATRIGDDWIVTRVREEGPAVAAGVQVGWRIVTVDGRPELLAVTPALGRTYAFVFEDENGATRAMDITAVDLPPRPLQEATRRDDGVVVLRFDRFDDAAVAWLETQIAAFQADPPRGVILDVRDNGGGLLASLGQIVAMLHRDQVAYARQKGRFIDTEYVTRPRETVWTGPVAILTGPASGSASELLAAHLQEFDRGLVVGQTSAGAVIGSRYVELADGGVLSLSLNIILTPRERRSLEGVGVTPDLVVEPSLADRRAGRDVVLEAAVAALLAD